jgi:hypothetical protein
MNSIRDEPRESSSIPDEISRRKKARMSGVVISAKVVVRPPKWHKCDSSKCAPDGDRDIPGFLRLQSEYLDIFRKGCIDRTWTSIHNRHFDWWQFPIDDGSRQEFNLKSESHVDSLRSNADWLSRYRESVSLVAKAWGWNVETSSLLDNEGGYWDKKDVRLAKIIRSLWLFEQADYLSSMQVFAHHINETVNEKKGLYYGKICLDEVLYMKLPRR